MRGVLGDPRDTAGEGLDQISEGLAATLRRLNLTPYAKRSYITGFKLCCRKRPWQGYGGCMEDGELGADRSARRLVKDPECLRGAGTVRTGTWVRRRAKVTLKAQN